MRDFLEDAHKHQDSGYGRAQKSAQRVLPKRFYKSAGIEARDGGFAIVLDGKQTKTPGKVDILVPSEALANAMAAEWNAQGENINPDTMPLVRLINSAIEGGAAAIEPIRTEMINYAGNDLLLYRADTPRELVARQEEVWDPVLVALARRFDAKFQPTVGIIHQPQPQDTLDKLAKGIASHDLLTLAAMMSITGMTGSALLSIALKDGLTDADAAWTAAHVDEDHNIRLWGEDPEVTQKRVQRRVDFDAALQVIESVASIR